MSKLKYGIVNTKKVLNQNNDDNIYKYTYVNIKDNDYIFVFLNEVFVIFLTYTNTSGM